MTVSLFLNMDVSPARELLELATEAERKGFDGVWVSDHFHPWFHTGAHEGFAWVLISAILERTKELFAGTCVTAPIYRYHPAIIAEAFATLGLMYPGRVSLGLGLGEAMNEIPLGYNWPPLADERIERFEEAIEIIRLLWSKNFVTYKGRHFRLNKANLYDKPSRVVPIYIASNGPKVTRIAGRTADGYFMVPGLMSDYVSSEKIISKLISSLEAGAEEAGRNPSTIKRCLILPCSYDKDYDRALVACRRVASNMVPNLLSLNVYDPRSIEALGNLVEEKAYNKFFVITDDAELLTKRVEEYSRIGISQVQFANFGPSPMDFIKECGKSVIPSITGRRSKT